MVSHDKNVKGRWMRGQVTEVTKEHVIVDDVFIVKYDLLVIASGSRYPSISGGNISKEQKKIPEACQESRGKYEGSIFRYVKKASSH